jgi:hypothetical protein
MNEGQSATQFSTIWKWTKRVGAPTALLWVIIQIWNYYSEPTDRLEAAVRVNEFRYPPQFYEFIKNVRSILSTENLSKRLANSELAARVPLIKKKADEISSVFSDELSKELITEFEWTGMAPENQIMLQVTVCNSGKTPLEDVRLQIPNLMASRNERSGQETIRNLALDLKPNRPLLADGGRIDIGQMTIGEKVVINAWKYPWPFKLDEPLMATRFPGEPPMAITHHRGYGKLIVMAPIPADSWSYKFYKLHVGFKVIFLICVLSILVFLLRRRRLKKGGDAGSAVPTSTG